MTTSIIISDAIPLYEQLLSRNKSSKPIKNLADCYYHTSNMKAAALWYGYLAPNYGENIIDESYHFKLNQSLKAIGGYRKANLEHCIKNYKQNGYFRGIDLKNLNKE